MCTDPTHNHAVPPTTLVYYAAWAAGGALIVLACVGVLREPFAELGLAVAAVASVHWVRIAIRATEARDREHFEMGRDSMRLVDR